MIKTSTILLNHIANQLGKLEFIKNTYLEFLVSGQIGQKFDQASINWTHDLTGKILCY